MADSGKKGFTVLNPGVMTSVQDFGRTGYQQFGVSVSGAMDPRAMRFANLLVGNPENEAVLEKFLAAHPDFSPVPLTEFHCSEGYKTFTCDDCDCDGFFVGRLKKEG